MCNPVASFVKCKVYTFMIFIIGWRGEPDTGEPQHISWRDY